MLLSGSPTLFPIKALPEAVELPGRNGKTLKKKSSPSAFNFWYRILKSLASGLPPKGRRVMSGKHIFGPHSVHEPRTLTAAGFMNLPARLFKRSTSFLNTEPTPKCFTPLHCGKLFKSSMRMRFLFAQKNDQLLPWHQHSSSDIQKTLKPAA